MDDTPTWRPSGRCAILVCDIVSFSDSARHDRVQEHLRTTLYAALHRSFDISGIPFAHCYWEDRGDGVIIVVPPAHSTELLLWPLADQLRAEIRKHNEFANDITAIGLRVAVHEGPIKHDGRGLVGSAVIHVCRLLDGPRFKSAVERSSSRFGVIVSPDIYDTVVRPGNGVIGPDEYAKVHIQVKETNVSAWMRIPGPLADAAPPPDLVAAPPRTTPTVPPRPNPFTIAQLLLAIPPLTTPNGRDDLIGLLPQHIATRIPRRSNPLLDMQSILMTCADYPDGLGELLRLTKAISGDSVQLRQLEDIIARLTNDQPPGV